MNGEGGGGGIGCEECGSVKLRYGVGCTEGGGINGGML